MTFSYSLILTYSYFFTQTITVNNAFLSNTIFLSFDGSTFTYIITQFVYYEYNFISYSTCYSYYSNFFTLIRQNELPNGKSISTQALIGIICGSFAAVFLIIGVILFVFHRSKNDISKSSSSTSIKRSASDVEIRSEHIDHEMNKLALDDEDQWI